MNPLMLFISPRGRIRRGVFWLGFAAVMVASLLLSAIRWPGQPLVLLLLWPQICIYGKRLHDMGRSAWLLLLVFAALAVIFLIAAALGLLGFSAGFRPAPRLDAHGMAVQTAASHLPLTLLLVGFGVFLVGLTCSLAFLLWVGLSKGAPAGNRFGPPPGLKDPAPAAA